MASLGSGAAEPQIGLDSGYANATIARSALWLCRNTCDLVGREQQVSAVLASLHRHRAAVIWGSPGEGKTAVAAEAGCRLQEDANAAVKLSAVVDMNGARVSALKEVLVLLLTV